MTFATSGDPGNFEMAFRHVRLTAGKFEIPCTTSGAPPANQKNFLQAVFPIRPTPFLFFYYTGK
jgi:hypothetical protein